MPIKKNNNHFAGKTKSAAGKKKTTGKRVGFYRKSMQGGMCDVMAYKNDHGDQSYVSLSLIHI